jgi:adhesin HecA-like repeat protein
LSSRIAIRTASGTNEGELAETIDVAKTGSLKGLIASEALALTIDETFNNKGQMAGGREVLFEGKGRLTNDGNINKTDKIESHLPGFENSGIVRAIQSVNLEDLKEEVSNKGLILSDGALKVSSTSKFENSGFIEGRNGDVTVSVKEIDNTGLMSSLGGKLNVETENGVNTNLLFGKDGIDLTLKSTFENKKTDETSLGKIKSDGAVVLKGEGKLLNSGSLDSKESVDLQTNVENSGRISAQGTIQSNTTDKSFLNTTDGQVVSDESVTISNSKSFTNQGLVQGKDASVKTLVEFQNQGKIIASEGRAILDIQEGVNEGTVSGKAQVDLTIGKKLTNGGTVQSEKSVSIEGQGAVTNTPGATIRGDDSLVIKEVQVINAGTIASKKDVRLKDIAGGVENKAGGSIVSEGQVVLDGLTSLKNSGTVQGQREANLTVTNLENGGEIRSSEGSLKLKVSQGSNSEAGVITSKEKTELELAGSFKNAGLLGGEETLSLTGIGSLTNDNLLQGQKRLEVTLDSLINNKDIKAGEATLRAQDLRNQHDVLIEGKLDLDVQKGSNTGTFQAKALSLTLDQTFNNAGKLRTTDSTVVKGKGHFHNEQDLISDGNVTFSMTSVTNDGLVQAQGNVDILHQTQVTVGAGGKILSGETVTATEQAVVDNRGLISSKNDIVLKQHTLQNPGKLEAKGNVSLPNITTLVVTPECSLVAKEGKVDLPQLKSLKNNGVVHSHETFNPEQLTELENNNTLKSDELLILKATGDVKNTKTMAGQAGVQVNAPCVNNNGSIVSEQSVDIVGGLENNHLISGKTGVSITAPKGKTIKQGPNGKIQSPQGKVTLKADEVDPSGEVSGKDVEIHSLEKPFALNSSTIIPSNSLTLNVPKGFELKDATDFPHTLNVNSSILNAGPLRIKGDFTWNIAGDFINKFDLFVEGLLTLNVQGNWTNLGNIQAGKGSTITAHSFSNGKDKERGTFYSSGTTTFTVTKGFANWGDMELWGDWTINAPQGSILNHPGSKIRQKNFAGKESIVNFSTAKNVNGLQGAISNTSADVSLDGKFIATTDVFLNEQAKPETKVLSEKEIDKITRNRNRHLAYKKYANGIRIPSWGKGFPLSGHRPVTVDIQSKQRSLFSAGGAEINADTLKVHGSVLSFSGDFRFNGKSIENLSNFLYERGIYSFSTGNTKEIIKIKNLVDGGNLPSIQESYAFELIGSDSLACIHSSGNITLTLNGQTYQLDNPKGPGIENNGDIKSRQNVTIQNGNLINKSHLPNITKVPPAVVDLSSSFVSAELKGPSFWKEDTLKETGFKIIPNKPIHLPNQEQIHDQLNKKVERADYFWDMSDQDLVTIRETLTPDALIQVPPRIALIKSPALKGLERMHHHPALLAELVTKTYMEALGVPTLSSKITTPELFTRILEESAYLNARRLHGTVPVPTPGGWDKLAPQDQIARQQQEKVTLDETTNFKDPGLVYQVREDFGEHVLSAIVTFPQSLRDKHKAVAGRITAEYLKIDNKEVQNHQGALVGHKALAIKATDGILNDHGYMGDAGHNGAVKLETEKTLTNKSGLIEGAKVDAIAQDMVSETVKERFQIGGGWFDVLHQRATMRARSGDLNVTAHNDHIGIGALYQAGEDANFTVGGDQKLVSQTTEFDFKEQDKKHTYHRHTLNHQKTEVVAGRTIQQTVDGNALFQGHTAKAGQTIQVKVGGSFFDVEVHDEDVEEFSVKKKGTLCKPDKSSSTYKEKSIANVNHWVAPTIGLESAGDLHLRGTHIEADPGQLELVSEHERVFLEAAQSHEHSMTQESGGNAFIQTHRSQMIEQLKQVLPELPRGVKVSAAKGLVVDINKTIAELENNPATAWIKDISKLPHVKWNQVEDIYKEKTHKTRALSAGGAAIIALALSIVTGGAATALAAGVAAGLGGGALGVAAGHVAAVGFQYLVQQVAVCVTNQALNKKLDIGQVFKDMGSKANLRGLANAMAVAAIVGAPAGGGGDLDLNKVAQHVHNHFAQGVAQAAVDAAQGEKVGQDIGGRLINVAVNVGGAIGANFIGDLHQKGKIGYGEHKVAHVLLGAGQAIALDPHNPVGALGAGVAAGVAVIAAGAVRELNLVDRNVAADIGKVIALVGAVALGQDPVMAGRVIHNAIEHNDKNHQDKDDKGKEDVEGEKEKPNPAQGHTLKTIDHYALAQIKPLDEFRDTMVAIERPNAPSTPRIRQKYESLYHKHKMTYFARDIACPGQKEMGENLQKTPAQFQAEELNNLKQKGLNGPKDRERALEIGSNRHRAVQMQAVDNVLGLCLPGMMGRAAPKGNPNIVAKGNPAPANQNVKGAHVPQAVRVDMKGLDLAELKHVPANIARQKQFLQHDKISAVGGKAAPAGHSDVMRPAASKPIVVLKANKTPVPKQSAVAPRTRQEGTPPQKTAPPAEKAANKNPAKLVDRIQEGRQFQSHVHKNLLIPENNKIYHVSLPNKGVVCTKPDLPLPAAGVTDIKDVRYITFTKQLQAQAALAKQEGKSFNLIISPNTERISKQVWDSIQVTNGKILEFNPATQKWIERIVDGNKVLR